MKKEYQDLFVEMALSAATLAERVMDYDKKKNDNKGYGVAESMRDDYLELHGRLKDGGMPTYNDYTKLLAAAYMITNNLQDQVTMYQKAINGYKTDTIPKLSRIMDETKNNPDEFEKLVHQLFD